MMKLHACRLYADRDLSIYILIDGTLSELLVVVMTKLAAKVVAYVLWNLYFMFCIFL